MKSEYAQKILNDVRNGYDLIADDFSRTRKNVWPEFNFLFDYLDQNDIVLDLGCGNGRFFNQFKEKEVQYYGTDNSEKLIDIAKKENLQGNFQTTDGFKLPFSDSFFNKIYSLAVFHHIPSKELREEFIKETKRVLKKEGLIIFTVWNLWNKKGIKFLIFKNLILKIFHKTELDFKDVLIPWRDSNKNILFNRYIHLFTKRELMNLFKKNGFSIKVVGETKGKSKNFYIIASKLDLTEIE